MNCLYCDRRLSNPYSMARGYGPVCSSNRNPRNTISAIYATPESFLTEVKNNEIYKANTASRPKYTFMNGKQPLLVKTDVGFGEIAFEGEDVIIVSQTNEETEAEYTCNKIADILGMPIAKFGYINIEGKKYFATELFVLPSSGKNHEELIPAQALTGEHSSDIKVLQEIIQSKSTQKTLDTQKLIQMVVFDALVGNNDRHNENISFIAHDGNFFLSPIYDNMTAVIACSEEKELENLTSKIKIEGSPGSLLPSLISCKQIDSAYLIDFANNIIKRKREIQKVVVKETSNAKTRELFLALLNRNFRIIETFLKQKK